MGTRITYKRKRPNPLFQEWLEELHEEAKEKGSKLEPMLREALESLAKYPLPLNSGADCAILRGFHKKLCMFLDRRLDIYKNNLNECKDVHAKEGSPSDESSQEDFILKPDNFKETEFRPLKLNIETVDTNIDNSSALSPSSFAFDSLINDYKHDCSMSKKKSEESTSTQQMSTKVTASPNTNEIINLNVENKNNEQINNFKYKPKYRSGGHAILIALLEYHNENHDNPLLTKEKLIEKAQKHCEESFTTPKSGTYYTAWSNMGRLISKELVNKINKKKTYYTLTKEGILLAEELLKESASKSSVNDIIFKNASFDLSRDKPSSSVTDSTMEMLQAALLRTERAMIESVKDLSSVNAQCLQARSKSNSFPLTSTSSIERAKTLASPVFDTLMTDSKKIDTTPFVMKSSSTLPTSGTKPDDLNNNCSATYSSNDFGKSSKTKLLNADNVWKNNLQQPINPITSVTSSDKTNAIKVIEFQKASFDIILLVDKNETSGVSKKRDPTVIQFQKFPDLKHEYRSLKVGDFLWVARHRVSKEELVLPYIVERKRMDDLGASIKDGRFHEQKFRLKKCGLPHVTYLIESYGQNKHVGLSLQTLKQAIANTKVQDGFKIYMTASLTHSIRFLAMMTKRLTLEYEDQILRGWNCEPSDGKLTSFEFFSKASVKTKILTVKETFIKMLLQLKGMSLEKALAVTNKYTTPRSLIEAYKCSRIDGQLLLANLKYGDMNRNIGQVISKAIYDLFSELPSE